MNIYLQNALQGMRQEGRRGGYPTVNVANALLANAAAARQDALVDVTLGAGEDLLKLLAVDAHIFGLCRHILRADHVGASWCRFCFAWGLPLVRSYPITGAVVRERLRAAIRSAALLRFFDR